MLFDLEAHEASIPVAPPVPKRQRQEPKQLVVPAQDWEEWSQIVCCAKMAEAKTGDIVSVPSVQHGGYLHCATDWQPYAEQMLQVLSAEPLLQNTADGFAPQPDYRPLTKFENRGLRLGHGVWDLVFQRRA